MTFIPPGFCEATVTIRVPGDEGPAQVVIGHDNGPATNAQQIADDLATVWGSIGNFEAVMTSDHVIESVLVRANFSGPDLFIGEAVVGQPGSDGTSPVPPQVSYLIQKLSGLAGRSNRGRTYLPGIPEVEVGGDGRLSTGQFDEAQQSANNFRSSLDSFSLPMVILHVDPALTPTSVVDFVVNRKVATQRRRLR